MSSEVLEHDPAAAGEGQPEWLPPRPDISHLVTEDDTPVDNVHSERNMRLLADALHVSWQPERPFVALANVGLFYQINSPAVVPDFLLSLDVLPLRFADPALSKVENSYFVWEYGKAPEMVIEIVSNREGGELDRKLRLYAQVGVTYYVIFDPKERIQDQPIRVYELIRREYHPYKGSVFPDLGLALATWEGTYQNYPQLYLRWADLTGKLLPTGEEAVTEERAKVEAERAKVEKLAARLRELGVDPASL